MSTDFNNSLDTSLQSESKLTQNSGKVARFAYTQQAFDTDTVAGTESYNYNQEQNIPLADSEILQISDTILSKGLRSQASSFTRMGVNHFFGRCSYNINKLASHLKTLFETLISFMKEGDNAWSPTAIYEEGDVVYFMSTQNSKPCKRTFVCKLDCPSANLPPVYTDGSLINTTYWDEISGRMTSLEVGTSGSSGTTVATINGDIDINGDIYQNGTPYETHAEQLYTKKDTIIMREDAVAALPAGTYSGLKVLKYDGTNNCALAVDNTGTARVGDYNPDATPAVDDTQPLLTRAEVGSAQLQNGGVLVWNNTTKRAETTTLPTAVTLNVTANTTIQDYTTNVMAKITASGVTLTLGAISEFAEVQIFAEYDTTIALNGTTDVLHASESCKLQYVGGTWYVTSNDYAGKITNKVNDRKPFGTLLCDGTLLTGTDETKYPRLWKELTIDDGQGGETGLYNLPTDSPATRRLPDGRNKTLMGANPDVAGKAAGNTSNVGDVQKAQVPNIKGTMTTGGATNYYNGSGGAIIVTNQGNRKMPADASSNYNVFKDFRFDAAYRDTGSKDHLGDNVYYGDFDNTTEANRTYGELRSANIRILSVITY